MEYHRELLKVELGLYGHQTTHEILCLEQESSTKALKRLKKYAKKNEEKIREITTRLDELSVSIKNSSNACEDYSSKLARLENDAIRREQIAKNTAETVNEHHKGRQGQESGFMF